MVKGQLLLPLLGGKNASQLEKNSRYVPFGLSTVRAKSFLSKSFREKDFFATMGVGESQECVMIFFQVSQIIREFFKL